jgi:hypothetical protein
MNNWIIILLIIVTVALLIHFNNQSYENFQMITVPYPNWYAVSNYNPIDWLVNVYPDRIQPSCLPYSVESKWGSLENMNYNSQAYRFWRF